MSDSVWPHRWQLTRLPRPWDSPGKNTGVGCHFLLQCLKVKSESEVAQSCLTLSDPVDCSLPGSSIHGLFQARVLEWGAIAFSSGHSHSQLRDSYRLCPRGTYGLNSLKISKIQTRQRRKPVHRPLISTFIWRLSGTSIPAWPLQVGSRPSHSGEALNQALWQPLEAWGQTDGTPHAFHDTGFLILSILLLPSETSSCPSMFFLI